MRTQTPRLPATLFDEVTDIVAWLDRGLRYIYVNQAVGTFTGRPAFEFVGRTIDEMGVGPDGAAFWRDRLTRVFESARPSLFEFDVETTGGRRQFQATAAPVFGSSGRAESVFVISRDITDTRAIRLLEGAVHHLPTAVALVEAPSGRLLLRNERATEIFRVPPPATGGIDDYRAFVGFHADGIRYEPHDWPLTRSIQRGEIVTGEVVEILRGDGTRGFIRITSAPVRDASGDTIAGVVAFDDVTEEAAAHRRSQFLSAATDLLGESLEEQDVLRRLAKLAVPAVADWCVVHAVRDGRVELVAVEHANPERIAAAREMARRYEDGAGRDNAVTRTLAGGPGELFRAITDDMLAAAARDGAHLAYLRSGGYRSALVAPIPGRSGVIGSLTFVTAESGRSLGSDDLVFARDLGRKAGLALDNARLFAAQREARAEAETLHRIGSTLASKLDLKAILQAVTDETTALTGAEFGAFFYNAITEAGEAYLLYTLSGAPAEAFAKFPAPRATALFGPTFRGEGVIRLDDVRADARYGQNAPHYGMPRGHLPVRSYLAVAVRSRSGDVLGGLFFGHSEAGCFTARHEHLVEAVAAQAAVAIDNARLFETARAAEAAQARRAAELQVAEERLRLAVEGANVGLWNYDIVSGRLFWDARIREQFGVAATAAVTVDAFHAMVHPDDRQRARDAFFRAIEHGDVYDVEYRIGPAESPRWIRSRARAAYLADGSAYRIDGITLDITDRKRIEEERARLLEREQTARSEIEAALASRDEFLAAASHELRNPLNALQLQLGGLRRIAQRDPAALATPVMTRRLDKSVDQIARLVRLVDTLLDVSRIKSGRLDLEYDDVDLVAVARDAIRQVEQMAGGADVRISGPDAIAGRWDPLRIEQVLTNLLSNAVKYGDGKPVELSLTAAPHRVRIEVTDEGIGIPSDMLSRLFARFERLSPDRRRGGFGLGLWITRQIVHALGGRIDVRSEPGRGSTFSVELPRRPAAVHGRADGPQ